MDTNTIEHATRSVDLIEKALKHLPSAERIAAAALYVGKQTQVTGADLNTAIDLVEISYAASNAATADLRAEPAPGKIARSR